MNNLAFNKSVDKNSFQKIYSKKYNSDRSILTNMIIKKAMDKNIPIHEDKELLEKISLLEVNKNYPDKYYPAIAEIIAYINNIDKTYGVKSDA